MSAAEGEKPVITVVYWPIRFRGNFLLYVLEEAKAKYKVITNFPEIKARTQKNSNGYPVFAVPILEIGSFRCSQMPACVLHLANLFKLTPSGGKENESRGLMMLLNCNDILSEITMNGGKYKMWTPEEFITFTETRLAKWMTILNDALMENPDNAKALEEKRPLYYFGKSVCYSDFGVLAVLDGLVDEFGMGDYIKQWKNLYTFYTQMSSRPSVVKLWGFQKKTKNYKWCGGQIQESIEKAVEVMQKTKVKGGTD
ncbi:hypothetical protein AAMO2058_001311300 [Amorphochlora amoebiformis]